MLQELINPSPILLREGFCLALVVRSFKPLSPLNIIISFTFCFLPVVADRKHWLLGG